jgi:hypothetical protein
MAFWALHMKNDCDKVSKLISTPLSTEQSQSVAYRLWVAGGITVVSLILLVVKLCLQTFYPSLRFDDSLSVGLLVVAVLPWFSLLLSSAKLPGGWELVFREIKENQEKQGGLLLNQQEQIQALRAAIRGIVTKYEYDKLLGLSVNEPFLCSYSDDMFDELKRLRALNLICHYEGTGLAKMKQEYDKNRNSKFDLKRFFYITEEGRKYLKIRGEAEDNEL